MHKRYEYTVWLILLMAILVAPISVLTYNPTPALAVSDIMEIESPVLNVVADVDEIEPIEEDISPDEYEGEIVVASADEIITMQIIDGVKHFTNHIIG